MRRDLGDFQTPPDLAAAVVRKLAFGGKRWSRVLDPTCGTGSFLRAALDQAAHPVELIGVEIQESHCRAARALLDVPEAPSVQILQASIFDLDLRRDLPWQGRGRLLVLGNPPWITSAALGKLGSDNRPGRRNVKALPGLQALTGHSNFDIAEAVWLKLIEELAAERPTIAMLCKTSVARAVLELTRRRGLPIAQAAVHRIDASRWFGAGVGACLLQLTTGATRDCRNVPVYAQLGDARPAAAMGFHQGRLVADAEGLTRFGSVLGSCPLTWRQGLKHDAAAVMELTAEGQSNSFRNGLNQPVDIEPAFRYPLVKGIDLRTTPASRMSRAVIVTQERLGQETSTLEVRAPRLWAYLNRHRDRFVARKSAIYRRTPAFSLFGVGPYSFAPYKVAVCGLHRSARFQPVGCVLGRPVQLDDTCYFLPCHSAQEAALLTAICNHPLSLGAIAMLSFPDAKRPVTKGLLQRIDFCAILKHSDRAELVEHAADVLVHQLGFEAKEHAGLAAALEGLERQFHAGI
jgi:hypothetical protein